MSNWFGQNWDKLFAIFCSVILAGIVGYFSAIFTVKSEISILRERISKAETEINSVLKPAALKAQTNSKQLYSLQREVDSLKNQNAIGTQIQKLLDLRTEQERAKTLQELRQILKTQE